MKTLQSTFILLIFSIFLSCNQQGTQTEAIATTEVEMAVEGMVCAVGCAKGIEEKMSKLAGIVKCNVNFEENTASIRFDNAQLSEGDIKTQIENMNNRQYKVEVISVEEIEKEKEASEVKSAGGDDPMSVKESSFSFPHLLTYFMNNL